MQWLHHFLADRFGGMGLVPIGNCNVGLMGPGWSGRTGGAQQDLEEVARQEEVRAWLACLPNQCSTPFPLPADEPGTV